MFGIGKRVITVFAEIPVKCKTGSCTCRWLLIYPYFFLLAQGYKIFFEGFQCKHTAVAELSCKNRYTLCTLTHTEGLKPHYHRRFSVGSIYSPIPNNISKDLKPI